MTSQIRANSAVNDVTDTGANAVTTFTDGALQMTVNSQFTAPFRADSLRIFVMFNFVDFAPDPVGWLVIAGAMLHTFAYLIRDQIALRIVLLVGTFLYIAYYVAVPTGPLWPAIVGTSCIALASIVGLMRVTLGRMWYRSLRSED